MLAFPDHTSLPYVVHCAFTLPRLLPGVGAPAAAASAASDPAPPATSQGSHCLERTAACCRLPCPCCCLPDNKVPALIPGPLRRQKSLAAACMAPDQCELPAFVSILAQLDTILQQAA